MIKNIAIVSLSSGTLGEDFAKHEVNIIEVSQSILQEMFCMIMLVDVSKCNVEFTAFADEAEKLGENKALKINVMHEDIFNSMHRI